MSLFSPHKSGNITPFKKQKDFFSLLPKFFCRFRRGVPPTPYVHPIPPKVTQCHPRLRGQAEGCNAKMQKPGASRVRLLVCTAPSAVAFLIKSVVERSRPPAADNGPKQTPPSCDYPEPPPLVIVVLQCRSSYKQNTNLLYHHVSFLSNRNSAAKRSTGERKSAS